MISLAVKYRPQSFEEVVEQDVVKQVLLNQIKTNQIYNSYLFVGQAGSGKTTSARLFAKLLNGDGYVVEIDAASNNGIDAMRQLIEECKQQPIGQKYRIYIIDECHSLSNQAWQSLLKLIEEPPERSILIFCTTDSSKIPDTIISRVQQFYFYKISPKGIYNRLKFISENEQIKISDDALKYIAMYAEGGLRNAITLLEKCHYYKNDLSLEDVCSVIGCASYDLLFGIIQSIFNKEIDKVIDFINQSEEHGVGFYQLFLQIYRLLLDIQKYSIINDFSYTNIPDLYEEDIKDIIRLDNGLSLKLIRELKEVFTIRNINCQKDLFIAVILGLE